MTQEELLYEFLKSMSANWQMNMEYCKDCNSLKKAHKYNDIVKKYYDYKNLFFSLLYYCRYMVRGIFKWILLL